MNFIIFVLFVILILLMFASWYVTTKYYYCDDPDFKQAIKSYLKYIIPSILFYIVLCIIVAVKFISIKMGNY